MVIYLFQEYTRPDTKVCQGAGSQLPLASGTMRGDKI